MSKFLRSATTLLLGLWLYLLSGPAMAVVWYSYKSGNWNEPRVWTQDPSGTTLVPLGNTAFPGVNDEVVILPGVAITMHANNITVQKMTIDEAATLIVGGTTGHNFTEVYGRGRMEVSSVVVPGGNYLKTNGFATAQGGTLAFRGNSAVLSSAQTFNNIEIRLAAAGNTFTLGTNLTLNGTLTVHTGKLLIGQNDADTYTLKVPGNFYVEQAGGFEINKGKHIAELGGDLAIRAKVNLTSKSAADYTQTATHYVNLLFNNKLQNQELRTEAETILEQLKVDKGIGEENILHVVASRPNIFELRGKSNAGSSGEGMPGDSPAMNLVSGVARIGRNISIPRFLAHNSNCNIPVNATLWVDGGDVAFDGNAVIYGAVQISAGTLNVKGNEGVTLREQGRFQVDGGLATLTEFRTSVLGNTHIGSFVMNGGDLVILGTQVTYASFTLPHKTNTFRMSGGRIRIVQPGTSANAFGGWLVAADPANIRVTGGTVVMENPTNGEFVLSSTAPFYNLTLRRMGSSTARAPFVLRDLKYNISGADYGNTNQHLKVLNDLILAGFQTDKAAGLADTPTRNTILVAAPDAVQANTRDVYVGRNFVIEGYAAYQSCFTDTPTHYPFNDKTQQPLTRNTTVFFGDQNGIFSMDNSKKMANPYNLSLAKTGTLAIGNMRVEKAKGKSIRQQDEVDSNSNGGFLVEVNGAINVVSGIYDQGKYTIRLWGSVDVKDQLGVWVEGVTPSLAQVRFREDNEDVVLNTTDGAIFGNTRFNVGGGNGFKITSSVKILRLDYMNGKVNLGPHKLTVDDFWSNNLNELDPTKFSTGRLFYTNGSVSDGGLSIKIKSGTSSILFPIGEVETTMSAGVKYTPVTIDFIGGTTGGYITVIPVDAQLPTAKIGVEKMSYYWRIQPEGFATPPTVKYTFQGREEDADPTDNNDETHQTWVAGSVLASNPFTRSAEALITFAGTAENRAWTAVFDGSGSGFPLVRADYTAGALDAFTGTPTVYYNRNKKDAEWSESDWRNHEKWSTDNINKHNGPAVASGEYPKSGDIVILKNANGIEHIDHYVKITNTEAVAEVVFEKTEQNIDRAWPPRLIMHQNARLDAGRISGHGEIGYRFNDANNMPVIQGDMGGFMQNPENRIIFFPQNTNGAAVDLPSGITVYPSVRVHGEGGSASNRVVRFTKDIIINGDLRIDVSSKLLMNNGPEGNILVKRNLQVGPDAEGGILTFEKNGTPRTLTVNGNVNIYANQGTASRIEDGDSLATGPTIHRMVVGGNLEMGDRSQMRLENVALEVNGLADQSYTKLAGGSTAKFLRLIVNKPSDKTFSLDADMDLAGTSEGLVAEKQLVMTSGKLLMNHAGLDFTLNSGTSSAHFKLPQGTGLEVKQGVVRITATGGSAGFELDAPLTISGGNALFHSSINNFIEYSASGNAALNVSAGHLLVGGQLRRGLGSTDGVLRYTQTGGKVLLAAAGQPTQTSRGILDFANTSTFTLSGDANTLLLVGNRHNTTPDVGTIFIGQDVVTTFSGDSRIQLGYNGEITIPGVTIAATTAGKTFHVNAVPVLHNLTQRASTGTDHTLALLGNDLRISGKLEIQDKAKLDANGRDMYISGTWLQNGAFDHRNGHVYFQGAAPKLQRSNTAAYDLNFYKLTAKPTGLFTLGTAGSSSLQVKVNDVLSIEGSTKVEEGKPLWALNNMRIGAEVSGTQGLKLSSDQGSGTAVTSSLQRILPLAESLKVSRLNADNSSGVRMERFEGKEVDLLVTDKFELTKGTFDVGDNRLSLGENVVKIDGDAFGPDHQILVSGVASSWGVRKYYPAGSSSFAYPIGLPGKNGAVNKYRPVTLTVTENTLATGQQAGVLIRPVDEQHPNTLATNLKHNVLHFYWRVESNQLPADFKGKLVAKYEDVDILTRGYYPNCDIENYYGSAILDDNGIWSKQVVTTVCPTPSLNAGVDPVANTVTYDVGRYMTGDYTAGDTRGNNNDLSIPDRVRIYRTDAATATWSAGPWKFSDNGTTWSAQITETPQLGSRLVIQPGHKFALDRLDVRVFATEIQANATGTGELLVPDNSDGHNLGRVSGTGRIKLVSNTSSIKFPAGVFENFLTLTGGEVEYAGTGSYMLDARTTRMRALYISGGGAKTLVQAVQVGTVGLNITGNTVLGVQDVSADKAPAITVDGPIDIVDGTLDVGRGILTAKGATTLTKGALKLSALNAYLDGLAINGGELLLGSPDGMSFLTLTGNLSRSGTGQVNSTQCDPAFAKRLVLKGSSQQRITGEFATAKQCAICELELNNARGAQVNVDGSSKVEIRQKLVLTRGVLNTTYARGTTTNSYQFADLYTNPNNNANEIKKLITPLLLQEAAQVEGGSASAYVRGWMGKVLANGAQVTLPLGDAGRYKPATIQAVTNGNDPNSKRIWRGVYYAIAPDKTDFKARLLASEFASDPTAHVSASEYWVIGDRDATDASSYDTNGKANITLPWDASSGDIQHPDDMRIVKSQSNRHINDVAKPDWKLAIAATSQTRTGTAGGKGTVQAAGVDFSTHAFTFASIRRSADANVLPVELLSFQAKPLQAQVDLRWELANAHKLDRVEVQRSADGVSFRTEQTVYATGEGRLSQQWTDAQPLAKAYYRLMLLEQDGKYQYSPVQQVRLQASSDAPALLLYPNPTDGSQMPQLRALNLPANAQVQLELHSMTGQTVWQYRLTTDAAGMIEQVLKAPASLPTGVYILQLVSPQGKLTTRWIKQ